MKAIGYYNPFSHPISFTGSRGNMVEVSPNTPVTNKEGFLIASSEVLDAQVQNGLLKRIYDNHPDFKDFDKKVEKKKGVVRFTGKQLDQMPLEQVKKISPNASSKAKTESSPEILIDAKKGVVNMNVDLPQEAELQEDGTVKYRGKRFASVAAIRAYIANTGGNRSPNPLSKPIKP
jgi:hypothetical protein